MQGKERIILYHENKKDCSKYPEEASTLTRHPRTLSTWGVLAAEWAEEDTYVAVGGMACIREGCSTLWTEYASSFLKRKGVESFPWQLRLSMEC